MRASLYLDKSNLKLLLGLPASPRPHCSARNMKLMGKPQFPSSACSQIHVAMLNPPVLLSMSPHLVLIIHCLMSSWKKNYLVIFQWCQGFLTWFLNSCLIRCLSHKTHYSSLIMGLTSQVLFYCCQYYCTALKCQIWTGYIFCTH